MTTHRISLFALVVTVMLSMQARGGGVAYPALGHLRVDEGTIEVWLTPTAELRPALEPGQFVNAFRVFSLVVPDAFRMNCSWVAKRSSDAHRPLQTGLSVSMGNMDGPARGILNLGLVNAPGWEAGRPGHVAFVWRGRDMAIYADGVKLTERRQLVGFSGRLGGIELFIGDSLNRPNDVILHAVRVSSIAREPEALVGSEPAADTATLLLHVFDGPDAQPTVWSDLSGRSFGYLGEPRLVESPRPGITFTVGR